jgi:hypothetical protein
MNVFDLIRSTCEQVAESASDVHINKDFIADYVNLLPLSSVKRLQMDEENHFCGDLERTVNFFIVLDAINFGSGYFPFLKKVAGKTGYFTVTSLLKEEFERQNIFSCSFLQSISAQDCIRIFKQDPDNRRILPLMGNFAKAMRELGDFVGQNFSGNFLKLLSSADNQAAKLVDILVQMPYYQDVAFLGDFKVYFYKRAQITVSDLNIALQNEGHGYFSDLDELTIFADNLVPHVLWIDGLLNYSDELTQTIQNGQPIGANSITEIELRASAVHTVELMVAAAACQGKSLTAQQFDYLLWNRGQNAKYRAISPHITLSHFY